MKNNLIDQTNTDNGWVLLSDRLPPTDTLVEVATEYSCDADRSSTVRLPSVTRVYQDGTIVKRDSNFKDHIFYSFAIFENRVEDDMTEEELEDLKEYCYSAEELNEVIPKGWYDIMPNSDDEHWSEEYPSVANYYIAWRVIKEDGFLYNYDHEEAKINTLEEPIAEVGPKWLLKLRFAKFFQNK